MNFEGVTVAVENAGEAILPDTEFREGSASQWFEELVRVASLRSHDLVEFRDDSILNVWIERVELRCRSIEGQFSLRGHRQSVHPKLQHRGTERANFDEIAGQLPFRDIYEITISDSGHAKDALLAVAIAALQEN